MSTTPSAIHSATSSSQMVAAKPTSAQNSLELRQKKILDYADQALARSNALETNLGLVASDLMQVILWLRQDIERARDVMHDPLDSLSLTVHASEQLYKLSKQLHAYTDLIARLKQLRSGGKSNDSKNNIRLKQKPK